MIEMRVDGISDALFRLGPFKPMRGLEIVPVTQGVGWRDEIAFSPVESVKKRGGTFIVFFEDRLDGAVVRLAQKAGQGDPAGSVAAQVKEIGACARRAAAADFGHADIDRVII